jgi:hypothetical protein
MRESCTCLPRLLFDRRVSSVIGAACAGLPAGAAWRGRRRPARGSSGIGPPTPCSRPASAGPAASRRRRLRRLKRRPRRAAPRRAHREQEDAERLLAGGRDQLDRREAGHQVKHRRRDDLGHELGPRRREAFAAAAGRLLLLLLLIGVGRRCGALARRVAARARPNARAARPWARRGAGPGPLGLTRHARAPRC